MKKFFAAVVAISLVSGAAFAQPHSTSGKQGQSTSPHQQAPPADDHHSSPASSNTRQAATPKTNTATTKSNTNSSSQGGHANAQTSNTKQGQSTVPHAPNGH